MDVSFSKSKQNNPTYRKAQPTQPSTHFHFAWWAILSAFVLFCFVFCRAARAMSPKVRTGGDYPNGAQLISLQADLVEYINALVLTGYLQPHRQQPNLIFFNHNHHNPTSYTRPMHSPPCRGAALEVRDLWPRCSRQQLRGQELTGYPRFGWKHCNNKSS